MPAPAVLFPFRFCPLGLAVFVRSLTEPFPLPVVRALIFPEGVFYPATGKFPRHPPSAAAMPAPPVRPVPYLFQSARSCRFCPFLFRAVPPPRCPCTDFSRRRFLPRYREIPPTPSLCCRHTRPCCPSCSRSVSVRSVSSFLSVPLPSRFPFPPSLCRLFVFGGDLPTLPERNPPCPSSCPDRFRPRLVARSCRSFLFPVFRSASRVPFRCPFVPLLPSASALLSSGLSVFSP